VPEPERRTPTPPRHARQGSYLCSRGLAAMHPGQIGRRQHGVRNIWGAAVDVLGCEGDFLRGGREQEQARHSVVF
jgi:hypothetical protein